MVAPSSSRIDVGGKYVRLDEVPGDGALLLVTSASQGSIAPLAKSRVAPLASEEDEGFHTGDEEEGKADDARAAPATPATIVGKAVRAGAVSEDPVLGEGAAAVSAIERGLSPDDPAPPSGDGSILAAGSPLALAEYPRRLEGLDVESGHGAPSPGHASTCAGESILAAGSPPPLSGCPRDSEETDAHKAVTETSSLRSVMYKTAAVFALVALLAHRR